MNRSPETKFLTSDALYATINFHITWRGSIRDITLLSPNLPRRAATATLAKASNLDGSNTKPLIPVLLRTALSSTISAPNSHKQHKSPSKYITKIQGGKPTDIPRMASAAPAILIVLITILRKFSSPSHAFHPQKCITNHPNTTRESTRPTRK